MTADDSDSTGRRPEVFNATYSSRFRRILEYWSDMESGEEDVSSPNEPDNEQPSQPEPPVQPVQPETPSQPPVQPTTPSQPTQPVTPSQPTQPVTPSQPVEPATPSQPTQPVTPSEPPSQPEPSEPSAPDRPTGPKPAETIKPQDIPPEVLKVLKLNLNTESNSKDHKTSEFEIAKDKLIVRRGQTFYLNITFNRPYDAAVDDMMIVLEFGKNPIESKKTLVQFILSKDEVKGDWGAYIKSRDGDSVKIGVMSPANCYVGRWMFKIDVLKVGEEEISVYRFSNRDPIYVLFNPWCKDDPVYMRDTDLLNEYVMTEMGIIFVGSIKKWSYKVWNFGQFDGVILDCCMYLLEEKSDLPAHVRGDPVKVSRKLSALINSSDEGGVLRGNWSGSYEGGTSPLDWTGSLAILKEYYENKSPVKFGQCWVFSALFTTIGRALGIPIRSVTNFESAHDTDGSITIDKHWDEDGELLEEYSSDSIWNFHVWNDAWMARPDLPSGYGGWQAVDATPQESSGGYYCMGPMSLRAIKHGEVYYNFDGPFVYGEVNADIVNWKCTKDGKIERMGIQRHSVGKCVLTKSALKAGVENVTGDYKFEEGSREECASLYTANLFSSNPDVYEEKSGIWDVDMEVNFNNDTFVGEKIEMELKVINKSEEERTLSGTLKLHSAYYTGVHYRTIKKEKFEDITIAPSAEKALTLVVEEVDYLPLLTDHCMLTVSGMFIFKPTNQYTPIQAKYRLRKPHLTVKGPSTGEVGKPLEIEVAFKNPLSVPLTDCNLMIEGAGIPEPLKIKQDPVEASAEFVGKFEITPKKLGKREIAIAFNSKELKAISAGHAFTVS